MKRFIRSNIVKKAEKVYKPKTKVVYQGNGSQFEPKTIVEFEDQLDFQKYFNKKYGINEDLFYFDGVECIDNNSGETIKGAELGQSCKTIEKVIRDYYDL